jgi:hypothetical protein
VFAVPYGMDTEDRKTMRDGVAGPACPATGKLTDPRRPGRDAGPSALDARVRRRILKRTRTQRFRFLVSRSAGPVYAAGAAGVSGRV